MSKAHSIEIKESLSFLKDIYRKEQNIRKKNRIKSLICLKEGRFSTRAELANHLHIDYATLKRWLKEYRTSGLSSFKEIKSGGNRASAISAEIHEGLKVKLSDSHNPLRGYWDAVLWVQSNYGQTLNYHTLRGYLKRHFGAKKKHPRKSHYKKDIKATEVFKKNYPTVSNILEKT